MSEIAAAEPAPTVVDVPPAPTAVDADDGLAKYRKMITMLPEGAVRQKMRNDGLSASDIDKFFGVATPPAAPKTAVGSGGARPPPPPPPRKK